MTHAHTYEYTQMTPTHALTYLLRELASDLVRGEASLVDWRNVQGLVALVGCLLAYWGLCKLGGVG